MKSKCLVLIILSLILTLICICASATGTENDPMAIPDQIMEELIPYTNGDQWIQTYDLMNGGEWAVATLQGAKGNNLLFLFARLLKELDCQRSLDTWDLNDNRN